MGVGGASSRVTVAVVAVTSVDGSVDLRVGVASASALDVAGLSGIKADRGWQGESQRGDEEEEAGSELHFGWWDGS